MMRAGKCMWGMMHRLYKAKSRSSLDQSFGRCLSSSSVSDADVLIAGAGHNGLVAACLLAKQGLKVDVFEEKLAVGGACTTQYPFEKAPGLGQSTGAYLLGLMPPELLTILGLANLPLMKRDPHYFLPTTGNRYLLLGSDPEASKAQFLKFFSTKDWAAHSALQAELEALRTDIAPAMMAQPTSIEAAADRYIRSELRDIFVSLCRGSVKRYLERFEFESELLVAMYAATDGILGLQGGYDSPGGGMNFLTHNMCRLPEANGTWMIVKGGMGTVTQQLALRAQEAGARIYTGTKIESILLESGQAKGVVTRSGSEHRAKVVLVNADPFSLRELVGAHALPAELNTKLDGLKKLGLTMKVNLALNELPRYSCLSEDLGQHRTTTHLLPDEGSALNLLNQAYEDSVAGRLPEFPIMQVYTQTAVDQSLRDSEGRHSAAIFVHYVPHSPQGSSWEAEEESYVDHLLTVWERFAPGVKDLVQDQFTLTPPKIESYFGIKHGVIHHVDNSFGFDDRFPYAVLPGLYSCSAGCHPGGSVIGCAGHNSAALIVQHLGLKPWWQQQRQPFSTS